MLDFLKKALAAPEIEAEAPRDPAEAVAALLVEAATADGDYDDDERATIDGFLVRLFGLDAAGAAAARARGEAAQAKAADLVQFTRVVKTQLSDAERMTLLEALWSVVFADGERDPHEDALVRKLTPLIATTDRESAEARRRVQRGLEG
jgi:uncharacterized tellurite resistance protein B-like protein